MFETFVGPIKQDENKAYLRPETAQGIFVNFKHVLETMRRKLPFGVAQIGKSFRNEITPGNFTFRTREFEQMEIEYFVQPGEDDAAHAAWVEDRYRWYIDLGIGEERLIKRTQSTKELAHYAKACVDLEYRFPGSLGFSELEGVANRTDFDLTAHSKSVPDDAASRARLRLPPNSDFDQDQKKHIVPYVIEPSAGADRATLAFLCEAYTVEAVKEVPDAELQPALAQVQSFIKSAANSTTLSTSQKVEIEALGRSLLEAGSAGLPRVSQLLALPGAEQIQLGKKVRGQVERLIEQYFRTVLKLDPRLAPIKVAIFPLKRNNDDLVAAAHAVKSQLKRRWYTVYDDTGAIGKLYRRQDEIGTPFCVTVDFQTLDDRTVTVRDRDSMSQERIAVDQLVQYLEPRLERRSEQLKG
jgi:glycyl-tRNA synthetase